MMTWSKDARELLDRAVRQAGERAARDGADAAEVAGDLRTRAEQELAARELVAVATADVESVLARLGVPLPGPDDAASVPPAPPPAAEKKSKRGCAPIAGAFFLWVLPLVAVLWEVVAKLSNFDLRCGSLFFDPIPTWTHALLALTVPLANFIGWRRGVRDYAPSWKRAHQFLWGLALAAAIWFGLRFITVIPIAAMGCIAIIYFGIGLLALLPLSPYFALMGLVAYRSRFDGPGRGKLIGFSAGTLVLLTLFAPAWVTRHGLILAASDDPAAQTSGIHLLRTWGDRDALADRCFGGASGMREFPMVDWLDPLAMLRFDGEQPDYPQLYYRVYGEPFYATSWSGRRDGFRGEARRVDVAFDRGQGGDEVGENLSGLSLGSSRIDGHVEADLASAYLEWTLEFANSAYVEREARCQIALPRGASVSRLTLWINGEEREAAFGGRGQVTAAYKSVVQARRDPVLVNACGPDRIMMQCFPVPAQGRMKVRIGITEPLQLPDAGHASVRLPIVVERNFSLRNLANHDVWIEGAHGLAAPGPSWTAQTNHLGGVVLHAGLPRSAVVDALPAIRADRDASALEVVSADPIRHPGQIVTRIASMPPATAPKLVVVVDGSRDLHDVVLKALEGLPAEISWAELALVAAVNEGLVELDSKPWNRETVSTLRDTVRRLPFAGGQDNAPALARAWDLASSRHGSVLWLHGPCLEAISSPEALRQRMERATHGPAVLGLQLRPGAHRLVEKLDTLGGFSDDAVIADPAAAVRTAMEQRGSGPVLAAFRSHENDGPAAARRIDSPHPARLWARTQVDDLLARHVPAQTEEATKLATAYYLVTPVSGAVVLETKQQFDQAGLEAMSSKVATIVPEPSTWVLGLCGALLLAVRSWRRKTA